MCLLLCSACASVDYGEGTLEPETDSTIAPVKKEEPETPADPVEEKEEEKTREPEPQSPTDPEPQKPNIQAEGEEEPAPAPEADPEPETNSKKEPTSPNYSAKKTQARLKTLLAQFNPERLAIKGGRNGALNGDCAKAFVEKVLKTAVAINKSEGVECTPTYTFQLLGPIGEYRKTLEYELSVEKMQLKGEEGYFRITEEGLALAAEMAEPDLFMDSSGKFVELPQKQFSYMRLVAIYDDCVYATFIAEPEVLARITFPAASYNGGDLDEIFVVEHTQYLENTANKRREFSAGKTWTQELFEGIQKDWIVGKVHK